MEGRLHTRYAPVRRSLRSKLLIPLDLHVLSLPLAFILSQDQTLHRIFLIIYRRFAWLFLSCLKLGSRRALSFCPDESGTLLSIQYVYERVILFLNPVSVFQEAGAKVEFLFHSRKLFLKFFLKKFSSPFLLRSLPVCQWTPALAGRKGRFFFYIRQAFLEKNFNLFFL